MTTHITNAFLVTSALIISLLTTGIMPASTAHAASKGAERRSHVATARAHVKENPVAPSTSTSGLPHVDQPVTEAAKVNITAQAKPVETKSSTSHPAGNNGFVKVNEEIVSDSTPNNDPHVSCQFRVEFYNYDLNPTYRARVAFDLHNPTTGSGYSMTVSGNQNPIIGGDAAGGGNDLDASEAYRLTFTGKPHDKQGYHVKLTVHADGSQGADVKHKVFWVQPCQGHVLGSSTNPQTSTPSTPVKPASSVMPATLPSTGTAHMGYALTLIASVVAYILTLGAQKLRSLRMEV